MRKQSILCGRTASLRHTLVQIRSRKGGLFCHSIPHAPLRPPLLQLLLQRKIRKCPRSAEYGRKHQRVLLLRQQRVLQLGENGVGVLGHEHVCVHEKEVGGAAVANADVAQDVDRVVGVEEGVLDGHVHQQRNAWLAEDGVLLAGKTFLEGLLLVRFDVENKYYRTRRDTTMGRLPCPSRRDDRE